MNEQFATQQEYDMIQGFLDRNSPSYGIILLSLFDKAMENGWIKYAEPCGLPNTAGMYDGV